MCWQRDNNLMATWRVPRLAPKRAPCQRGSRGGPEPVPPEVPVLPVGTMAPGSNFGHRQRAQLGTSSSRYKVLGTTFLKMSTT